MILDAFAGPGGWDVGAADLGLETLGIELDPDACATREAAFGNDAAGWAWERPAPTLTGTRRSEEGTVVGRQLPDGEARNVGGWNDGERRRGPKPADPDWPEKRPATTVAGRALVPDPGQNDNRFNGSDKSRNDGIRVTLEEAAVLQGFPPEYPWRGTKTSRFRQVGNAVPPPLARAVLSQLT